MLTLQAQVLHGATLAEAARSLVDALALSLGCERVSLGLMPLGSSGPAGTSGPLGSLGSLGSRQPPGAAPFARRRAGPVDQAGRADSADLADPTDPARHTRRAPAAADDDDGPQPDLPADAGAEPGGPRPRLLAVSQVAEIAPAQPLAQALVDAMAQACAAQRPLVYPLPPAAPQPAGPALAALAALNGDLACLVLPLHGSGPVPGADAAPAGVGGALFANANADAAADEADALSPPAAAGGALLLERVGGFDARTLAAAQDAALFVGPLLLLRQQAEAPWSVRLRQQAHRRVARALAAALPRRAGRRRPRPAALALGLAAAALLAAACWPVQLRVVAPVRVEGLGQQVLAAPFDGYVAQALVKPGAAVRAGEVLLSLQDRDLQLEAARWQAEATQQDKKLREAQSADDATQTVLARARLEQAQAQLALAQQQLARSVLRAPFDGVLLSGDFSNQAGVPVRRGQELLVLAPGPQVQLVAEVDEQDIDQVQPGQRGQALLSALEGPVLGLRVGRVAPLAGVVDGRNVFEVEATLDAAGLPPGLRPGQRGVVRLDGPRMAAAQLAALRLGQWWRQLSWRLLG